MGLFSKHRFPSLPKGEELSNEAKAADTTGDLWSLFFKEATLDKIVLYTNDKIRETMEKNMYNAQDLAKQTYIKFIDKVSFIFPSGMLFGEHTVWY